MYKLELLINNRYENIELDSSFKVNFNYQMKDYDKPSDIKTGYSKTITIPGTPNNNNIFSNIYNLSSTYRIFKPNNKVDYRLSYNSMVISNGYMVVNNVDRKKTNISYKCTLYDYSTKKLYNIKYNESNELRYLSDLAFGFYDENEIFNYDAVYAMDSWSRFGDLYEPNNIKYESSLKDNSIKSYITPIYMNTGLYDNFDSNKILVSNIFTGFISDNHNPFFYNSLTKNYENSRVTFFNDKQSEIVDGKRYSSNSGWYLYETERDLHPSEAACVMSDRLPLGIDLGKTWDIICNNFDIDDSTVRELVHLYLDNTFMVIKNKPEIKNIGNQQPVEVIGEYEHNERSSEKNEYMLYGGDKPKMSVNTQTFDNNSNHKIIITPNILSNLNDTTGDTFISFRNIFNSPLFGEFDQGPYPPMKCELWNGRKYDYRDKKYMFDNILTYNLIFYRVKNFWLSDDGTETQVSDDIYVVCGGKKDGEIIIEGGSEYTASSIRSIINRNIQRVVGDIFGFGNYYIETKYLFSEWARDVETTNKKRYTKKEPIEIFLSGSNRPNDNGSRVEITTTSTTVMTPYIDGYQKLVRQANIFGYSTVLNKVTYSYQAVTPSDMNNYHTGRVIKYNVGGQRIDRTFSISPFAIQGGDYMNVVATINERVLPRGFITEYLTNYAERQLSKDFYVNGCYLIHNDTLEEYSISSNVSITSFSGSTDFKTPEISKQLLNNIPVADTFLSICKMFNMTLFTENILGEQKLKVVFSNDFYENNVVDVTDLVDYDSISIEPSVIKCGTYEYSLESPESYANNLMVQKGIPEYNIRSEHYDYNISNEQKIEASENINFKTLIDYNMSSVWFNDNTLNNGTNCYTAAQYCAFNKGSKFKQILFYIDGTDVDEYEIDNAGLLNRQPNGYTINQFENDTEYKLCGFDKDLKSVDFENSLVSFGGFNQRTTPLTLTVDIPATHQVNGNFCYILYPRREKYDLKSPAIWDIKLQTLVGNLYFELLNTPKFTNYKMIDENKSVLAFTNLDNYETNTTNLYDNFFENYNSWLFDVNNKVIKCKVKFYGYDLNKILRSVYHFDNSYFIINKLTNFDFSSEFNEVEFVEINYNRFIESK